MELLHHLAKATEASKQAAKRRRQAQVFVFAWRSSEQEYVTSWAAAAERLNISEKSLAVYLSKGRGVFVSNRVNPLTGELDILNVSRASPDNVPPIKRRGRKPKQIALERLGDPSNF